MDLLNVTEMQAWKVSATEVKLGSMLPDTFSLALPFSGSFFHITHDFCGYELLPLHMGVGRWDGGQHPFWKFQQKGYFLSFEWENRI